MPVGKSHRGFSPFLQCKKSNLNCQNYKKSPAGEFEFSQSCLALLGLSPDPWLGLPKTKTSKEKRGSGK